LPEEFSQELLTDHVRLWYSHMISAS